MTQYWAKLKDNPAKWELIEKYDNKYYFYGTKSEVKDEIIKLEEIKDYPVITFDSNEDLFKFIKEL